MIENSEVMAISFLYDLRISFVGKLSFKRKDNILKQVRVLGL